MSVKPSARILIRVQFADVEFRKGKRATEVRDAIAATFHVSTRIAALDIARLRAAQQEEFNKSLTSIVPRVTMSLFRGLAIAEQDRKPGELARVAHEIVEITGLAEAKRIKLEWDKMPELSPEGLRAMLLAELKELPYEDLRELVDVEIRRREVAGTAKPPAAPPEPLDEDP
jgi:hypothetical protein